MKVIDIQSFMNKYVLSQRTFAGLIGYSEEYISKIINGKIEINDRFEGKYLKFKRAFESGELALEDYKLKSKHLQSLVNEVFEKTLPKLKGKHVTLQETVSKQSQAVEKIQHFATKNNDFVIIDGMIWMKSYKVLMKAHAQYVDEFYSEAHDITFQTEYVRVQTYGRGNYLYFEIDGDSMDDGSRYSAPHGSMVLSREIGQHLWSGGLYKAKMGHIIITDRNILYKDIINFDKEKATITCHSRNQEGQYLDFDIKLGYSSNGDPHVKQIFKVLKIDNITG